MKKFNNFINDISYSDGKYYYIPSVGLDIIHSDDVKIDITKEVEDLLKILTNQITYNRFIFGNTIKAFYQGIASGIRDRINNIISISANINNLNIKTFKEIFINIIQQEYLSALFIIGDRQVSASEIFFVITIESIGFKYTNDHEIDIYIIPIDPEFKSNTTEIEKLKSAIPYRPEKTDCVFYLIEQNTPTKYIKIIDPKTFTIDIDNRNLGVNNLYFNKTQFINNFNLDFVDFINTKNIDEKSVSKNYSKENLDEYLNNINKCNIIESSKNIH